MTKTHLLVLPCLFLLGGCSSGSVRPGSIANLSNASRHGLEVESTPAEQSREEVLAMPTEFVIPIEQDRFAWERARLFLENYGRGDGARTNAVVKVVGSRRGLSSAPGSSPYSYEVFKDFTSAGYHYSVRCIPVGKAESDEANLNAGNLARFIRDGKLEVSLLAR